MHFKGRCGTVITPDSPVFGFQNLQDMFALHFLKGFKVAERSVCNLGKLKIQQKLIIDKAVFMITVPISNYIIIQEFTVSIVVF